MFMDIRYIYMHHNDAELSDSQWMRTFEADNVQSRALHHASNVTRCSVLVVERDPSTGFMAPLGFAAAL